MSHYTKYQLLSCTLFKNPVKNYVRCLNFSTFFPMIEVLQMFSMFFKGQSKILHLFSSFLHDLQKLFAKHYYSINRNNNTSLENKHNSVCLHSLLHYRVVHQHSSIGIARRSSSRGRSGFRLNFRSFLSFFRFRVSLVSRWYNSAMLLYYLLEGKIGATNS